VARLPLMMFFAQSRISSIFDFSFYFKIPIRTSIFSPLDFSLTS